MGNFFFFFWWGDLPGERIKRTGGRGFLKEIVREGREDISGDTILKRELPSGPQFDQIHKIAIKFANDFKIEHEIDKN